MDDIAKNVPSYQLDQEILDARGINITVEEVAGLSTTKYSERVQQMRLNKDDMAFLKGLRRRIKNRLASQNSRRRSMEQLRRLTRELRALRACKCDALVERAALMKQRASLIDKCRSVHTYVGKILIERRDVTPLPDLDVVIQSEANTAEYESHEIEQIKIEDIDESITSSEETEFDVPTPSTTPVMDKQSSDCRIDNIDDNSVTYTPYTVCKKDNNSEPRTVTAKTVFLPSEPSATEKNIGNGYKAEFSEESCVLNLSLKENGRRSHGRKQSAPRRIAYAYLDSQDAVLDLKVKKENQ